MQPHQYVAYQHYVILHYMPKSCCRVWKVVPISFEKDGMVFKHLLLFGIYRFELWHLDYIGNGIVLGCTADLIGFTKDYE